MLLMVFIFLTLIVILILSALFFFSSKQIGWEEGVSSSFECGFTSYFFSRYSFSMHYFLIGLIFLFLDLELCFMMPFFNGEMSSFSSYYSLLSFITILIFGVLLEWGNKKLDWKY